MALKKSLALVQLRGGRVGQQERDALAAVVAGLGQIVEASFVAPEQRRKIQALLEERADAEEQFEFRAHSMDSNAIVETLTEMEDKASESLTDARKREGEAAQSFALLKQGLESETASMKKELSENTNRKASLGEKLAGAQGDLVITQKSLAEDTAYLKDLKRDCQTRAREFEVEVKDNNAELTALGKAKAILLKKFALVQTTAKVHALSKSQARDDEDSKSRALRSIEQLGRKLQGSRPLQESGTRRRGLEVTRAPLHRAARPKAPRFTPSPRVRHATTRTRSHARSAPSSSSAESSTALPWSRSRTAQRLTHSGRSEA